MLDKTNPTSVQTAYNVEVVALSRLKNSLLSSIWYLSMDFRFKKELNISSTVKRMHYGIIYGLIIFKG